MNGWLRVNFIVCLLGVLIFKFLGNVFVGFWLIFSSCLKESFIVLVVIGVLLVNLVLFFRVNVYFF